MNNNKGIIYALILIILFLWNKAKCVCDSKKYESDYTPDDLIDNENLFEVEKEIEVPIDIEFYERKNDINLSYQ